MTFDPSQPLPMPKTIEEAYTLIVELCQEIVRLREQIQKLEQENVRLKAELDKPRKNSQNSSMPPSNDITRGGRSKGDDQQQNKEKNSEPKKRGAITPHDNGGRQLLEPTREEDHTITECPHCGYEFTSNSDSWDLHQLISVEKCLLDVCDHYFQKSSCPNCKRSVTAPHPPEVPNNQHLSENTDALLAYLHLHQHIPLGRLRQMVEHMTGLKLSEDAILNALDRVNHKVKPYTDQFLVDIKQAAVLGIDETSWFIDGVKHWAWIFRTEESTYILIDKQRSAKVPMLTLGRELTEEEISAFENKDEIPSGGQVVVINRQQVKKREYYLYEVRGTTVADNYTAYSQIHAKQDCLAHLIRHLKHDAAIEAKHGETTCDDLKRLLQEAIHLGNIRHSVDDYQDACDKIERKFDDLLGRPSPIPSTQTRLKSLNDRRAYIFPFLYDEQIPPTNNGSENDARKLVVQRKISGGSRSAEGANRTARISSFIQTAIKRAVDVLDALTQPALFFSTA